MNIRLSRDNIRSEYLHRKLYGLYGGFLVVRKIPFDFGVHTCLFLELIWRFKFKTPFYNSCNINKAIKQILHLLTCLQLNHGK